MWLGEADSHLGLWGKISTVSPLGGDGWLPVQSNRTECVHVGGGQLKGQAQRQRQLYRGPLGAGVGGEPVPQGQTQWTGVCAVTPWRDGASGQDADALRLGEPSV